MPDYPYHHERKPLHYKAPDQNWNSNVDDYDGYEPAQTIVGPGREERKKRENTYDVLLPEGQRPSQKVRGEPTISFLEPTSLLEGEKDERLDRTGGTRMEIRS